MSCSEGCTGGCGSLECGEGAAGLNGLNAFTVTTANFNQPTLINTPVTVSVSAIGQSTGIWAKVGQAIFIEGGGYYEVTAATATTITVEIPDSDTLTYNHLIVGGGSPVVFPAGVSPAGIRGPQGATGSAGTNGTDGTAILGYERDGGDFTSLVYTQIRGPYAIPANSWEAIGDTVRVKAFFFGKNDGTPDASNHVRFNFKMKVGTTDIVALPGGSAEYAIQSNFALNGILVELDLVAKSMSPFVIEVVPKGNFFGLYSVGSATHTPGTSGIFLSWAGVGSNALQYQPSVFVTSGINPTISNNFSVEGKHTVVGTGGGSASKFACPFTLVELLKK